MKLKLNREMLVDGTRDSQLSSFIISQKVKVNYWNFF